MPLFPSSGTYRLHSWSRPLIGWSRVSVVKMSVEHFTKALTTPVFPSIDKMVLPALVHAIHKPTPTQTENAEIPQALLPVSEFYNYQLLEPATTSLSRPSLSTRFLPEPKPAQRDNNQHGVPPHSRLPGASRASRLGVQRLLRRVQSWCSHPNFPTMTSRRRFDGVL